MIMMMVTGPGLWLVSQLLLILYFWLDNGANTCGIDFHFGNKKKEGRGEESRANERSTQNVNSSTNKTEEDSNSILNDDNPRGDSYFEFKVLEKLLIRNSKVAKLFISKVPFVSEEGRWHHDLIRHFP